MQKERTIIFDRLTSVSIGIALNAREYLCVGTVLVATPRFRLKYGNKGAVRAPVHPVNPGVPVSVT